MGRGAESVTRCRCICRSQCWQVPLSGAHGRQKARCFAHVCAGCWLLTLGTTIREPRLWEYGNPLVGGTANAYRYFQNEGQDLGQRHHEFKELYDRVIKPSGKPVYSGSYWAIIEEQTLADHIHFLRFFRSSTTITPPRFTTAIT